MIGLTELESYKVIPSTSKTHSEKKGIKTVPPGYYCYKWYPFFSKGNSTPGSLGHRNNTPKGAILRTVK